MLQRYIPGVGMCNIGYTSNAKQKAKAAANALVFYSCVSCNVDPGFLASMNGGSPGSRATFIRDGGLLSGSVALRFFARGGRLG